MLYKKTEQLSNVLFENPTKEYRGAPFWAWNTKLEPKLLLSQIDDIKAMGMGGFHIHCRVGLNTQYLGDDFFDYVKLCCEKAKEKDMLCWLYDEDRWPSGTAGGKVTVNEEYRSRFLVLQPHDYKESTEEEELMSAAKAIRTGNRKHIARFNINLDEIGCLEEYSRVELDSPTDHNTWDAFLEVSGATPWFNNQAYIDSLNPKAAQRFIELTHEKYKREVGEHFGGLIPSIFTDEPQSTHKERLRSPFQRIPVILPFTDDFDEGFNKAYGFSILKHLPELVWEKSDGKLSRPRYLYHAYCCSRFSQSFCDIIGAWCDENGILLTGHMMSEWTLFSQTLTMGEAMRPMKSFSLPGIDMLCDRREFSTAKQAASVAHQQGRIGVMSEIYGVTGWDFDFRGHKLAGDWQAALGVTVRVHHLTWLSMEGEGKRDYPASIGPQSPWYKEYPIIEDYFSRLNTALTRGKPVVRIGVVHPIESYWITYGVQSQTSNIRMELENKFENLINWLLYSTLDFDFISESMLALEEPQKDSPRFNVGAMDYEVVIVPSCITMQKSTLSRLEKFKKNGGKLVFMSSPPTYIDGIESIEGTALSKGAENIPFEKSSLLETLSPYRDVEIATRRISEVDGSKIEHVESGVASDNLIYQLRKDNHCSWLFVCHVNAPESENIPYIEENIIKIKGTWIPTVYDPMTGATEEIGGEYKDGFTLVYWYSSFHDSLLLQLKAGATKLLPEKREVTTQLETTFSRPFEFSLSEPNAFLLDIGEYCFDDEQWQAEEEILRIDNLFREKCSYPMRTEALAQPYTVRDEEKISHRLRLRFAIESTVEVIGAQLAAEDAEKLEIILNGETVEVNPNGYYVDKSLKTIALPPIMVGRNLLEVVIPFHKKANVEWMYLLGEFGVELLGRDKVVCALPTKLRYGDYTYQKLPFYTGNVTYKTIVKLKTAGQLIIKAPYYKGALIKVKVDDAEKGKILFAPYELNCGYQEAGEHVVELMLLGSRFNGFGAIHNTDRAELWHGPVIWRTKGSKWAYEYQIKEQGILSSPVLWIK